MGERDTLRCRRSTAGAGARRTWWLGASPVGAALALLSGTWSSPAMTPAGQTADSFRFTIVAPPEVRIGDPVAIALRLANVTDRPAQASFLGRVIAFDIVIAREDGTVVWRRLEGATVASILQIRMLRPHEMLEFRETWRQYGNDGKPVAPGTYEMWGLLPSDAPEPRRTVTVKLRILR